MIEIKAKADKSAGGVNLSITYEGMGGDLVEETIALIKGLLGDIKNDSKELHLLILKVLSEDPTVLLGDDEDWVQTFSNSTNVKIREGVN